MDKIFQEIDFEIIWKKIYKISSEEDDRILDCWLKKDRENREFFAKAEKYYRNGATTDLPLDVEKALRKVQRQLDKQRYWRKRIASVAAVFLVLIFSCLYWQWSEPEEQQLVANVSIPIRPGKSEAVLILNNGVSYDLTDDNDTLIDLNGARINYQGKGLEYVPSNKKVKNQEYNILKIPLGGEFSLILSDGTKVWLNSGTTLRYPVQFAETERRVELQGEAYFQVKKGECPFRVYSQNQIVEALGTQFNVSSYVDDTNILTTLVEGKVKISLVNDPSKQAILLPGSQSRFNKNENILTQQKVNTDEFISWKDGWFVFRNADLESMMNILSRWYNVQVIFSNERARSIKFTGDIKRYDNLNTLLSFIEKTNEVKFKTEGEIVSVE